MAKQIVKRRLMIIQGSIRSRLARTLFSYRLTPQTMTGISPRELLLGRHPRSRLDLLKSHMVERVERNYTMTDTEEKKVADLSRPGLNFINSVSALLYF